MRAACDTYVGFLALGCRVEDAPGGRIVSLPSSPRCYVANHLQGVSAASAAEIDALLRLAAARLGAARGHVLADPETSPRFLAELAQRGWRASATIQMVLDGPLRGSAPRAVEIRLAERETDWAAFLGLLREDHVETCANSGRAPWPMAVTAELGAACRARTPAAQIWLAHEDGAPRAYGASWAGTSGVGIVEDLFTHPSHRRRGLCRALIHHAVADARRRGAREMLIGARPDDTPKQLYAALGFVPSFLTASWLAPEA